jgi:hypothetical protein
MPFSRTPVTGPPLHGKRCPFSSGHPVTSCPLHSGRIVVGCLYTERYDRTTADWVCTFRFSG